MEFEVGDTVEVVAESAYKGEVGTVIYSPLDGVYAVLFPDRHRPHFAHYELKLSQQKLEIDD